MKKVLSVLALLAAAATLSAQPAATLGQLKARQIKERQELQTDQKRRCDQLKRAVSEDRDSFQHRQKLLRQEFEAALKEDERGRKKSEFQAQRKQKRTEFKRRVMRERERFTSDVQARWDFLNQVQAKETRQLDEKQRSELAHFQP